MPDLVTHAFSVYGIGLHRSLRRIRWLFYFAAMLPDLITRPIYILRPQWFAYTIAGHTPIFMVIFSLMAAEFFDGSIKNKVRWAMIFGCGLHFLLDFFQRHLGAGYFWLFPFSWRSYEMGLFWPEATIKLVPIWLLGIVWIELFWQRHEKKRG